jgi:hypothetical protein
LGTTPSEEAVPDTDGVKSGLVFLPDLSSEPLSLLQVLVHLGLVMKIIADNRIYVGQPKRGILLNDGFGRHSLTKCFDHDIERHARIADPNDPITIADKWRLFLGECK